MIPDQPLIKAMADAAEGLGVLFFFFFLAATTAIVNRAKELVRLAAGEEGLAVYREGESAWDLHVVGTKGWIFFFPLPEISPTDEVRNPSIVYYQSDPQTWRRLNYDRWVARSRSMEQLQSGSIWERLKGD